MMKRSRYALNYALLLSALAFLPGCSDFLPWKKDKHKASCGCPHAHEDVDIKLEGFDPVLLKETVVSMNGKPIVTGEDTERDIQLMMQAEPSIKEVMPLIPEEQQDEIYGRIIDGKAIKELMIHWVHDTGIDQQPEYIRNAQRIHEAVDGDLALRAFENQVLKEITITDQEAQKFYQQKRTEPLLQQPPFLITAGGTKAEGFEVANQKEAEELLEKARAGNFAQVAKEANKHVVDYGLVNRSSFLDEAVKDKILESKATLPEVAMVKGSDGKYRVIILLSRQEPKYADFEQVKEAVHHLLKNKNFNDLHEKKLDELKEKYKLVVNKDYVQKRKKKALDQSAPEVAPKPQALPQPAKPQVA